MIINGVFNKDAAKLSGKRYSIDLRADALYVNMRPNPSAYSEYRSVNDELYLVDYDKDGNVVGLTVDNFLEKVAKAGLSNRARIFMFYFLESLIPLGVLAGTVSNGVQSVVSRVMTNNSLRTRLLPYGLVNA
jgi:uncharacterized protein YuzE